MTRDITMCENIIHLMSRNPTSDFETHKCQLKVWFWTNFKSTFGFFVN